MAVSRRIRSLKANGDAPQQLPGVVSPASETVMDYSEFLNWAEEGSHLEWVHGRVVPMSPVSVRQQEVASFLDSLIAAYVHVHGLGKVLSLEFQMKLQHSGREPDVLFIAADHVHRLHETYLEGPADLVVEVASPESAKRDRQEKLSEYEQGGVREYWLIDPQASDARFFRLNGNGRYDVVDVGSDSVFRSEVLPGFWLNVHWLWKQPLPDTNDIMLMMDRSAYAAYLQERLRRAGL